MIDDKYVLSSIAGLLIHNEGITLDEVVAKMLDKIRRQHREVDPEAWRERITELARARMAKWESDSL